MIAAGRYTSSHQIPVFSLSYEFLIYPHTGVFDYAMFGTLHYTVPRDTVSDRTLYNVALLNRHGVTARRGEGKQ